MARNTTSVTRRTRSRAWTIAPIVAVCGAALYAIDFGFATSTITEYPLLCSVMLDEGRCRHESYALPKVSYKVYPRDQVVEERFEGLPPTRLASCSVVDRQNWKCKYPGTQVVFGMEKGQHWQALEDKDGKQTPNPSTQIRYVNRWKWLLQPAPPRP